MNKLSWLNVLLMLNVKYNDLTCTNYILNIGSELQHCLTIHDRINCFKHLKCRRQCHISLLEHTMRISIIENIDNMQALYLFRNVLNSLRCQWQCCKRFDWIAQKPESNHTGSIQMAQTVMGFHHLSFLKIILNGYNCQAATRTKMAGRTQYWLEMHI